MSSPSYLEFKPAPIWMVLVGSSTLICMALASLTALKESNEGGMAGSAKAEVALRLRSLYSAVATAVAASLMLSYSQFSAC
jgi:hypothetical protein